MKILNEEALNGALHWLGHYLKIQLKRESWQVDVDCSEGEASLFIFPESWRLPGIDDYVAFSYYWPNELDGERPCVELYVPTEEWFPQHDELLNRVRPKLERLDFTDHYEGEGSPDPLCPLWKNIPIKFNSQSGFDPPALLSEILNGFQQLMEVENIVNEVMHSAPQIPTCKHALKTIAVLDTEWDGMEPKRKMKEVAIVNVAYDPVKDEVVGVVGEYDMKRGQRLNEAKARSLLERAEKIVAHNCAQDESLLERELPGIEKSKWICSLGGIDWKTRLGVKNADQNTLTRKMGIRYEQQHQADADAHDLVRILAQRDEAGRTFVGRLLDMESTHSAESVNA